MIQCDNCGCVDNHKVTHTRPFGDIIRRRRVCTHCDKAFWTEERAAKRGPPPAPTSKSQELSMHASTDNASIGMECDNFDED